MIRSGLPIDPVLPEIVSALHENPSLLITAEPGAGKSTVVPLALLESGLAGPKKILMLEPRVLAARSAAKRMAFLLGEETGETVGYRTKLETKCSSRTRIEVVTEAVLVRMLQHDPSLEQAAIVIFDEFHERSIHADLSFAMSLDARSAFRDDLKIVLMSATLCVDAVSKALNGPPVIEAPGRCFPVRVLYAPEHLALPLEQRVRHAVNSALRAFPGDALVFLPGEPEIRRAQAALREDRTDGREILPLYGALPPEEQDRVFEPHPESVRRVILATSVAETSLTIPGVRIVIDAGLMRVPRFSPATGMDHLETLPVTKAGAEQRRGRAGRTAEGVCIRLWSEQTQGLLEAFPQPEILSADLAPACLELSLWGCRETTVPDLPWVDPPPAPMIRQGFSLLRNIGAVSENGTITPHGKQMLTLPLHPRLAHAALLGGKLHAGSLAADIGAILESRDLQSVDLRARLRDLDENRPGTALIRRAARRIDALLPAAGRGRGTPGCEGVILAAAYPDRIARRRDAYTGEYTLANGVRAFLPKTDSLADCEFLTAAEISSSNGKNIIRLAVPAEIALLERHLPEIFSSAGQLDWDPDRALAVRSRVRRIGSVAVSRTVLTEKAPDEELIPFMQDIIRRTGYRVAFDPAPGAEAFRLRVCFLHENGFGDYPDFSEEGLLASLETWLSPFLGGVHSFAALRRLDLRNILSLALTPAARRQLDPLAPERLEVPSGSHIRIDYANPHQPTASVRLQELFGMERTPLLAGKVPLLIDILSPAMRTVQKTSDLHGFWRESYFLVRKDMRGRYPKHDWPEDPLSAAAHRGVRKPKSGPC